MKTAAGIGALFAAAAVGGYLLYGLLFAPDAAGPAPAASDAIATLARAPVTHVAQIRMPDIEGVERSISEWDGQPMLINFWATWCPPCRKEIPLLIALQDEFADRHLQVIGIAIDDLAPVQRFAAEIGINYPLLVGEQAGLDAAEALGLSVIGLPITVFTRADGSILTVHQGELHRDDAIRILGELGLSTPTVTAPPAGQP